MIGLTDRVQPWARRFQRARPTPERPEAKDDTDRAREGHPRTTPRRFVRRVAQPQKRY